MRASVAAVLLMLTSCANENAGSGKPPGSQVPATASVTSTGDASSASSEAAGDPVTNTWVGQIVVDAHAGAAVLNYVGPESGDFVPLRFRIASPVGSTILAECADQDMCEVKGVVQFLSEIPPDGASAVGNIVSVESVRKLASDA